MTAMPSPVALNGYRVCSDVTFCVSDTGVLASNHRARRHVWLSLALFSRLAGMAVSGELRAADRTRFGNVDGLLSDPTCLDRAVPLDTVPFHDLATALNYLAERFIVVLDEETYAAYFAKKHSLVDRRHFGTFHQQLGAELTLRTRIDPSVWWYRQKFDPETGQVLPNLYKFVQEAFLERYLADVPLEGRTVLDFGCGSGMASRRFVARGARVIGVDIDQSLLAEAARVSGDRFRPVRLDLSQPDPLGVIPSAPLDWVWLSDVLLFYFYPQEGGPSPITPADLLRRLTARLSPGGRCVIMQPHGTFWLSPWLGDATRPFTVLTEYATRLYSVVPTLEELSRAIAEAGLAIGRVWEPQPVLEGRAVDRRAYEFATAFPQWWVFECFARTDSR